MFKIPASFLCGRIIRRFPSKSTRISVTLNAAAKLKFYSTGWTLLFGGGRSNNWKTLKPRRLTACTDPPEALLLRRQMAKSARGLATLETLNFDNSALRQLPLDPVEGNSLRQVRGACFSRVTPTSVKNPRLVAYSASALGLLDLPESEIQRKEFVEYFAGNRLLRGSETAAHCYCGHQFGNFAGQLGDGTVVYLGEILNKDNERWEVQLKGAGKTPYSRDGDGRKVLRSSIREFLCSEAVFYLGIPTTRAGCCVTSDSTVIRDIFYDGRPIAENCTLVTRIAPSFIRFGSFQICKGPDRTTGRDGPSAGRTEVLQSLANHVINTYYPEIWERFKSDQEGMYAEFFKAVVFRTASLVAEWQSVGFCHGVLNTDNMSILGLTIDYGPFGFMDRFDPDHICNTSDPSGRYAYNKQPEICKWNCLMLAEALQVLVPMDKLQPHLEKYDEEFTKSYLAKMRKKFGILNTESPEDKTLISSFLETMEKTGGDFTTTFRCLSNFPLPGCHGFENQITEAKKKLLEQCSTMEELQSSYAPRMDPRQLAMFMSILRTAPELAALDKGFRQVVIEVERAEKLSKLEEMTEAEKKAEDASLWNEWIDKYMMRLKFDISGITDVEAANAKRIQVMNSNNPKFILRNYIAQNAIDAAEKGDFSEVRSVLNLLQSPYSDASVSAVLQTGANSSSKSLDEKMQNCSVKPLHSSYFDKPPTSAAGLRVT